MSVRAPADWSEPDAGCLLCFCLTAATVEEDLALAREYGPKADILELRVDRLLPEERVHAGRVAAQTGLPVILTIRRKADGGSFDEPERQRIALYERLIVSGFAFVDLEEDLFAPLLEAAARAADCRIIRSLHDIGGVPADLEPRVSGLARNAEETPKAAVTPLGVRDLVRLLRLCESMRGRAKILIGMGDYGIPTRILAPRLGSRLAYASAAGMDAAPGHLDPLLLDGLYRFHSQSTATDVFGVIGDPIAHSLSPLIHNKGLAALGLDAVYVPFRVDDTAAFFDAAAILGIRGFSVTIPHKERVLPFLSECDPLVRVVGACNTVSRSREDGTWRGMNTDVEGFLAPLRGAFGGRLPSPLRATIIGAGGAARAVAAGLTEIGAEVLVCNRGATRAEGLARAFGTRTASLDDTGLAEIARYRDLIVQTTSVGMDPNPDNDPIEGYRFTGSEVVFDLVYAPPRTAFLRRAEEAGCRTIPGRRMLLAQASAQFKAFTGREYPPELLQSLEARLARGVD